MSYHRKGPIRRTSLSVYREPSGLVYLEQDVHLLGPDGPKREAAALGQSLVDFFRSVGIELHPTKNECEFTTRRQDDANAESSDS